MLRIPAAFHLLIRNVNAYISISREVTKIFTNRKKIFAVGMACLLVLSLIGCYEYRGPYTKADVEEYLTGGYPDETIHIRQKGLQTWDCWFGELPDAVFQVWVGQGGGDPVPMLYSRLVSDEAEVIPAYYLEQYQKEGGSLDAWELSDKILDTQYASIADAAPALEQLSAFFTWIEGKPLVRLMPKGQYKFQPELPWRTYSPQFHSFQEMVVHGPQDKPEAVEEALEDSVKKYYAFYCLPCDEFSQTELEEYAVKTWPWTPKPRVRQGEEILPPELLAGIGLESGVISYGGLYTLLTRLDFDVKGTEEHFTVTGADGHSYEFSYSFWEEREMDWTNNQTITLPVWYHLRDGYPVGVEGETSWFYRGPVIDLDAGWNIDTHNGHFHFYMPFWEIAGLRVSWDNDGPVS
ncbi:MAG: hypothetical protein HFG43_02815 [Lachnospiraceae bacterium]|nr:hypothetical protein [Lachnospiraceae bacterium]